MGKPITRIVVMFIVFGIAGLARGVGDERAGNPVVEILPTDSERDVIYKAAHVVPTERQVQWQELEFIAFTHNGPNTYTGREWGTGHEDESIVNPKEFNADEIVRLYKEFGIRMLVLIVKHHDGFCVWPTATTDHCIRKSPWRDGKGDMLGEIAKACDKHGVKLGIYLSPWDMNQTHKGVFGTPAYNAVYAGQLREVLSNYGPIWDVWMDGAGSPSGEWFDWAEKFAIVRELQLQATISICGPDVRWVGNEGGDARPSEWSVIPESYNAMAAEIGSLDQLKKAKSIRWQPAQTDTSLRPGWFWHADEDNRLKTLDRLVEIYYDSVGGNSQLMLNVPLDQSGKFRPGDVKRMMEFRAVRDATFAKDFAAGAKATADVSDGEHTADKIADGDKMTYWTCPEWTQQATVEFALANEATFNVVMLQEQIRVGQRIEKFAIDAWRDGKWEPIGEGTTVGYKKLLRIPDTTTGKVRVRILGSRVCPTLSNFGLYCQPAILIPPTLARNQDGKITMTVRPGIEIRYTLDGATPTAASTLYGEPIELPDGGVVTAKAFAKEKGKYFEYSDPVRVTEFGISRVGWQVQRADGNYAQTGKGKPEYAFDGNPEIMWHTDKNEKEKLATPPSIEIDLGRKVEVTGFGFLPRQNSVDGIINQYAFYVSEDGKTWGEAASTGRFDNIENNPIQQVVRLAKAKAGRYIKFEALSVVKGPPYAAIAELEVFGKTVKP